MNPAHARDRAACQSDRSLPVIGEGPRIRPSRAARRRAFVLVLVHLVIIVHVTQWLVTGRTLSPLEPSESMETLETGRLNAGFVFFGLALAATLVFGRFLCGWGCHWIAYQDLCGWMLRKVGIKPRPLRSRLLLWVPMAVAFYMFFWPRLRMWWRGIDVPPLSNHLLKSEFWETFPGPGIAVASILLAGFAIVHFLGNKGFCTYACPYGALFGLLDKFAPGSIRVTEDCDGCGHCTATCTSNVRVHEQVRDYGMVVDPGCMKTLDCVSVCPKSALYFGFGRPAAWIRARPAALGSKLRPALNWPEEILLLALFGLAFFAIRGLYELFPLLAALGMSGIVAYLGLIAFRLAVRPNVRLHNFLLKRDRRVTGSGWLFVPIVSAAYVLVVHSGLVQYHTRMGAHYYESGPVAEESESPDGTTSARPARENDGALARSLRHLQWVDRWGLRNTLNVTMKLGWLHAGRGQPIEAERYFRRAMELSPDSAPPHAILAGLFMETGRPGDAVIEYGRAAELDSESAENHYNLGVAWMALGQTDLAINAYRRAVELDPGDPEVRNNLGLALADAGQIAEAVSQLNQALDLQPDYAEPHLNLGRIYAAAGQTDRARPHFERACLLDSRFCDLRPPASSNKD